MSILAFIGAMVVLIYVVMPLVGFTVGIVGLLVMHLTGVKATPVKETNVNNEWI